MDSDAAPLGLSVAAERFFSSKRKKIVGVFVALWVLVFGAQAEPAAAQSQLWPKAILHASLTPDQPFFVPLHSRVTTTIRLPLPLEEVPVGDGFWVEHDGTGVPPPNVEYVIAWQRGDPRMDLKALPNASLRNLNLSLAGKTYVLVCVPAKIPLEASAAINFEFTETQTTESIARGTGATEPAPAKIIVERVTEAPPSPYEIAGPARWIGFLDRLHLLHAAPPAQLAALVRSMPKISVASFACEQDHGLFTSILLRVVRDDRLDLIGFIFLLKNNSKKEIVLDVTGCAARVGAAFSPQLTADISPRLKPGEVASGYFVIEGGGSKNAPLRAENDWRISFKLLDPKYTQGEPGFRALDGEPAGNKP